MTKSKKLSEITDDDRWVYVIENDDLHRAWSNSGEGIQSWIVENRTLIDGVMSGIGFPSEYVTDVDYGGETLPVDDFKPECDENAPTVCANSMEKICEPSVNESLPTIHNPEENTPTDLYRPQSDYELTIRGSNDSTNRWKQ